MKELTPEQQNRVQEIKTALEQELRETPTASKTAIKDIEDLKEDALIALRGIMKHSPNESLKAKVSMWAYDTILASGKAEDNPLNEFLKEMHAAPTT